MSLDKRRDSIPKPPDGGWGWVVVAASFVIHAIVDGIAFSMGELYEKVLQKFEAGNGATSSFISTMVGVSLCVGPISSSLVSAYGNRAVTIAGSVIAAGFFLTSRYAPNITVLLLTAGLGTGFGFGLIYLPAVVCVTCYFENRRSFATGIAMCGTGFGTMALAPLLKYSVANLGLEDTFVVIAVLLLSCSFFGLAFVPLKKEAAPSGRPEKEKPEIVPLTQIGAEKVQAADQLKEERPSGMDLSSDPPFTTLEEILRPKEIPNTSTRKSVGTKVKESSCRICINEFKKSVKEMLNFEIMNNPIFVVFAVSNFLTSVGFDVPFVFIPIWMKHKKLNHSISGSLISVVGIGNIFGRIILTYVADKKQINKTCFYGTCLLVAGITDFLNTMCSDEVWLNVIWLIYGFFIGAYVALSSVITADLFGLVRLTNALGIILLFQGVAALIGPPIAGLICDYSKSYDSAFHFSGITIALSGIMLYPIGTLKMYLERKYRNERKQANKIYIRPEH